MNKKYDDFMNSYHGKQLMEKKKVFEAGLARVNEELGKMGIK